ncbi:MAG: hypothetical protein S4CHLAM6_13240 [Chlamydiae bacterium]|nr:hypothetical protein [Chlamydiota bacterium]
MLLIALILTVFFALQVYLLCTLTQIFRKTQKLKTKQFLDDHAFIFFYGKIYDFFYKQRYFNGLFISCVFAKNIARFGFGVSAFIFISSLENFKLDWTSLPFILFGLLIAFILLSDLLPRLLTLRKAKIIFLGGGLLTSFYLAVLFPLLHPFLKITQYIYTKQSSTKEHLSLIKEKMFDLLKESLPDKNLEANDRLLIESILKFKERIVREVMVPRMDVFALPASMPIKEAAKTLKEENYSRIPVYEDSLDYIKGIVLYKDIFNYYMDTLESGKLELLEQPIGKLLTKSLYTPETRKISHLMQEFLQKQQHLALVVDEFGAIEGVVTIEDLLEEIVGEIADEYDDDEENLYTQQKDNWIVNGRMSLFDIEQNCHVKIPRLGDYDTIGGYIIHRAGTIPAPNLKINHDDFELEVISTTDRQIKKVKISPRQK